MVDVAVRLRALVRNVVVSAARFTLGQRVLSEGLASAALAGSVVGSAIMAWNLTHDDAVALFANTAATGAALAVLILVFGPISGAHMNPAVSILALVRGQLPARDTALYCVAQFVGAAAGVVVANAIFSIDAVSISQHARSGVPVYASEALATAGLLVVIELVVRTRAGAVPFAVGAYISAGYWATSSMCFANPAVTAARTLTSSAAGIAPGDAVGFFAGQLAGFALALVALKLLAPNPLAPNLLAHAREERP